MNTQIEGYTNSSPESRFLRTVLYLVHSNVFISLSTTSIALSTILLTGLPIDYIPLFIVFAATLFVYNLNRFTDRVEDARNNPARAEFFSAYGRYWLLIGVVVYVVSIGIGIWLSLPMVEYLLLPLVVGFVYSVFRAKELLLIKNLLVGVSWGIIPLGVGAYYGALWRVEIVFLAGYVASMIFIAAVIFDIKDITGDKNAGIRTIPLLIGPARTRQLALVSTFLVAGIVILLVAFRVMPLRYLVVLAVNGYVAGYIPFAKESHGPLFYGFIVDGEHIFLGILVLILQGIH